MGASPPPADIQVHAMDYDGEARRIGLAACVDGEALVGFHHCSPPVPNVRPPQVVGSFSTTGETTGTSDMIWLCPGVVLWGRGRSQEAAVRPQSPIEAICSRMYYKKKH